MTGLKLEHCKVRKHEEKTEDQHLTDEAIAQILRENADKVKRPVVGFHPDKDFS